MIFSEKKSTNLFYLVFIYSIFNKKLDKVFSNRDHERIDKSTIGD